MNLYSQHVTRKMNMRLSNIPTIASNLHRFLKETIIYNLRGKTKAKQTVETIVYKHERLT